MIFSPNWISLAKSHAPRAQVPLRSIHGRIIRDVSGRSSLNAFNRGSKWKMSCQVQRVRPYRRSSNIEAALNAQKENGNTKKFVEKTFHEYTALNW